ncbi:MAG TPA: hypothetical protein V6D18_09225 [Thermosynechococcaceae cyanobacterium]
MDHRIILVPQGAEHRAVCRGLRRSTAPKPIVQAIPVGAEPVRRHLLQLRSDFFQPQAPVLVLGLCGSLSPRLSVGDVVLYRSLSTVPLHLPTSGTPHLVTGLTLDRVLSSAAEKRELGASGADVVDMEGQAILEVLNSLDIPVTMLRVVSDDCHYDLPDLSQAVSPEGNLLPGRMAIAMAQKPIAALRLIRGSLHALKVLQAVVSELYQS